MKKIFARILACLLLVSTVLVTAACKSCKGCNGCSGDKTGDSTGATQQKELTVYNDGVHEFNITETTVPLVKNGMTDYVVVLPKEYENSVEQTVFSAIKEEFSYLFKEATGISIRINNDTGLTHSAGNHYISIGETSLFETAGLSYDRSELGMDGVRIMTKDNTLFLLGGTGYGPLYAVYTFMERMFNFDAFDVDCFIIDRNVKDINFKSMDVTDIPDMERRERNLGSMVTALDESNIDNKYYGTRLRMRDNGLMTKLPYYADYNPETTVWYHGHNVMECLPKAVHAEQHPNWYSNEGEQLCYTARGDDEELRAMAEEVVKKTIWSLYRHPKSVQPLANSISLSVEDNYNFCTCDTCKAEAETYNAAGSIVRFTNLYASIFQEWNDGTPASQLFQYTSTDEEWLNINIGEENRKEYIREDFSFYVMAYNSMMLAPAKYDSDTQQYLPIDESCMLNDNVILSFCDIEMDWSQSYFAEDNKDSYENILAWSALSTKGIHFYNYAAYPDRPLWFYDAFDAISKEQIAFMLNCGGISCVFDGENYLDSTRTTGFKAYWSYLQSKLLWNVNQDVEELTEKYFSAAFGTAKDIMRNLFAEERNYFQYQYEEHEMHIKNSIYNKPYFAKYWDKNIMKKWINDCYLAFDSIEKIKESEPKEYASIYNHIAAEMIYPATVYLEYFSTEISTDEKTALVGRLLKDYEILGLSEETTWYPFGNITYKTKLEGWAK